MSPTFSGSLHLLYVYLYIYFTHLNLHCRSEGVWQNLCMKTLCTGHRPGTLHVVLAAGAPQGATVRRTVTPDQLQKGLWGRRQISHNGKDSLAADFPSQSSNIISTSSPCHCFTCRYTHRLCYLAAVEVGGRFCGCI